MGNSSYDTSSRFFRAKSSGYTTVTADSISSFGQNVHGKAHEEMLPKNAKNKREARDSETHPNTLPIQVNLDVTGSMGETPAMFIRDGLPKLVSGLIQSGIPSPALLFGCIGDHECDRSPLQLGQFESGDVELDMWLERSWIEKGGGGNGGESYLLGWFNAANFVVTDAWEKRKQKGFVFTIGDEPTLHSIPGSAIKEIYGDNIPQVKSSYTAKELLEEALKTNYVFHIHVNHNGGRVTNMKDYLGQNVLEVDSHEEIPELIYKTVNSILSHEKGNVNTNTEAIKPTNNKVEETKITL